MTLEGRTPTKIAIVGGGGAEGATMDLMQAVTGGTTMGVSGSRVLGWSGGDR